MFASLKNPKLKRRLTWTLAVFFALDAVAVVGLTFYGDRVFAFCSHIFSKTTSSNTEYQWAAARLADTATKLKVQGGQDFALGLWVTKDRRLTVADMGFESSEVNGSEPHSELIAFVQTKKLPFGAVLVVVGVHDIKPGGSADSIATASKLYRLDRKK